MFTEIIVFFANTWNTIATFFADNALFVVFDVMALLIVASVVVGIEIAKQKRI